MPYRLATSTTRSPDFTFSSISDFISGAMRLNHDDIILLLSRNYMYHKFRVFIERNRCLFERVPVTLPLDVSCSVLCFWCLRCKVLDTRLSAYLVAFFCLLHASIISSVFVNHWKSCERSDLNLSGLIGIFYKITSWIVHSLLVYSMILIDQSVFSRFIERR